MDIARRLFNLLVFFIDLTQNTVLIVMKVLKYRV